MVYDQRKDDWCRSNNHSMLRVAYDEPGNLKELIQMTINLLQSTPNTSYVFSPYEDWRKMRIEALSAILAA